MGDDRLDEPPAEIGNHIEGIAAADGRDLQVHRKHHQQRHRHAEGRHVAQKQRDRQQDLVEALADVSRQRAQQVAQQPADDDGRKLQRDGPADGAGNDVAHLAGILAERGAQIAPEQVLDEDEELFDHGLVGAELLLIALVDLLHGAGVGHALGHLAGDGRHRVGGHQPGQHEIQYHGDHQRDQKPHQLLAEVFAVSFHNDSPKSCAVRQYQGRGDAGSAPVRLPTVSGTWPAPKRYPPRGD